MPASPHSFSQSFLTSWKFLSTHTFSSPAHSCQTLKDFSKRPDKVSSEPQERPSSGNTRWTIARWRKRRTKRDRVSLQSNTRQIIEGRKCFFLNSTILKSSQQKARDQNHLVLLFTYFKVSEDLVKLPKCASTWCSWVETSKKSLNIDTLILIRWLAALNNSAYTEHIEVRQHKPGHS